MNVFIYRLKDLSTIYLYLIILSSSLFTILIDSKSLRKKELKKESRLCKAIGYFLLALGTIMFFAARYVL